MLWKNIYIFEDNSIDVVYSYKVLEHLQDIDSVFKEVKRILKQGGIGYFTMPKNNSFYKGHYECFRIPFILSSSKISLKLYLKLIGKNPSFISEINFTTPFTIRKKAIKILNKKNVFILPWSIKYLGH